MKYKTFELLKLDNFMLGLLKIGAKTPRLTQIAMKLLRPFYVDKETPWNRIFRWGLLTFGAGLLPADEIKAYSLGVNAFTENFRNAMNARKNGRKVVWVEWIISSELIAAFDAIAFNAETLNVFGNVASTDTPSRLIEEAENRGIPIEYCSALKLTAGAYMLGQTPEPDAILRASQPCDTSVSAYQIMEYLTDAPAFTFDCPYWKDESSVDYYEKNVRDMIAFLEKTLGRKIDWEKLRKILNDVNRFNSYLQEMNEMMMARPSPCSMITLLYAWVVREIAVGSPHATKMAREMHRIVKRRYEKGEGVVKKEKIRVVWWNPPIGYFTYVFKWMEDEFGAVVVTDFIGNVMMPQVDTSTPDTMVRGIAESHMNLAMGRQCHGPVEYITSELERAFSMYSADCMIFAGHNGCQHGWAVGRIIKEVCRRAKIPALFMNGDIMDQRILHEDEIKRQIRDFFRSFGLS